MKGSELIKEVQALIDEFGDLEVGILNAEFLTFDTVSQAYYRNADNTNGIYDDDVELNNSFIAID